MPRAHGARWGLAALVLAGACFAAVGSDGALQRPGLPAWGVAPRLPGALLGLLRPRGAARGAAVRSTCSLNGGPDQGGVLPPQAVGGARRFSVRRADEPPLSEAEAAAQREEFSSPRLDERGRGGHARRARGSGTMWREAAERDAPGSAWFRGGAERGAPESAGSRPLRGSSRGRYIGDRSRGGGARNIRLQSLDRYARMHAASPCVCVCVCVCVAHQDDAGMHAPDSMRVPGSMRAGRAHQNVPRALFHSLARDARVALMHRRPADMARDLMEHVDGRRNDDAARNREGRSPSSPGSWGGRPGSKSWGPTRKSLVPKNLASFQQLESLLPIFEDAMNNGTRLEDVVAAPDAVAAMNHLKRLTRQARGQAALSARLEHVLQELARVAEAGIPYMSAKNVALVLNSVSHRQGFDSLYQAGAERIRMLCRCNHKLHTQSLAMMVNALVKRRMLDASLVQDISQLAQEIEPEGYSPQSVAIILNAFSKVASHDSRLFRFMSSVAMQLRRSSWDAQACALLLNSFARSGERDEALFSYFEGIIVEQDIKEFSAQNVANIVNAYAKCSFNQTGVFRHMSAAARAIPPSHCDAQAVANILNGFSRMDVWDAELFAHMSQATMMTPTAAFSAQGVANTLNAHARMNNRHLELFSYMSQVIQEACALQGLTVGGKDSSEVPRAQPQGNLAGARSGRERREVLSFDPQAVANIVNAFARLDIRDEELFALMEEVIYKIAPSRWDAQAVALVLNAYARLDLHPLRLFEYLADLAATLPARSFNAQAVANVANALAKANFKHEQMLDRLAQLCNTMKPIDFTGQAVSSILNAYAKLEYQHPQLFQQMAHTIMDMPLATFQPQAIANIVNAYLKTEADDVVPQIFRRMSEAALRNPPGSYSGQAIGVILNAYVRKGRIDEALFSYISKTVRSLPPTAFDAQNIALVTNAFAKAEIFDEALFARMAQVAMQVEVREADSQNVAVIINAYAKADMLENEPTTAALMGKLAVDIPRLSPENTNAQAIGNIVSGYARFLHGLDKPRSPEMADADATVFRSMATMALGLRPRPPPSPCPPSSNGARAQAALALARARCCPVAWCAAARCLSVLCCLWTKCLSLQYLTGMSEHVGTRAMLRLRRRVCACVLMPHQRAHANALTGSRSKTLMCSR